MPSTGSDARSPAPLQRLRVTRAGRLDELDRSAFEELAAGASLMVSWSNLRAVEADPAVEASYLQATDGEGRLVGVLPCYLWDGGPAPALDHYDPVDMGGGWLLGTRARPQEWRPTLFLGTRSGYVNEWLVHPRWRSRTSAVLRPLLREALRQARGERCGSVAAMWLTAAAACDLVETIPVQNRLLLGSGSAALEVDFDSFDGYLAGLSPSRRHTVRRDRARFAASALTVREARLSECCRDLARLAAPLQEKYRHRLSVRQLEADFRRQAQELDSCSWVLLCQRRGRPVGFTLFYRWEGVLYGRAAGFDYPEVQGTAAYFNLAFYLPIEHAIATRAGRLHLGLASWGAKVLRGAELEPTWLWIVPPRRWRSAWPRLARGQPASLRAWLEGELGRVPGGLAGPEWERPERPGWG